jgi:acetyl-CoA carboxylase carboxyl transferase subunit alpha
MELAEKFRLPIVTLVDTPGAYPGLGPRSAARPRPSRVNMREMSRLKTPHRVRRHRRGRLGGALGIGVGRPRRHAAILLVLGHLPRGLRRDPLEAGQRADQPAAADALKLTANDNLALGIVDGT